MGAYFFIMVYAYSTNKEQKLVGVFSEKVPAPSRIFYYRQFLP
mgnify:CR=1 FL=1